MALDFTGMDTDVVNLGQDATLDNIGRNSGGATIMFWIYVDAWGASSEHKLFIKGSGSTRALHCFHSYWAGAGRVTFNMKDASYSSEFETQFGSGQWECWALHIDPQVSSQPYGYAYKGTLDTAMASQTLTFQYREAASADDSSDDMYVGGDSGSTSVNGRIAMFAAWGGKLTADELRRQQFCLYPVVDLANLKTFNNFGWDGTSSAGPDLSGNGNNGTVTGATVAAHVPLEHPFVHLADAPYVVAAAASDNLAWKLAASRPSLAGIGGLAG